MLSTGHLEATIVAIRGTIQLQLRAVCVKVIDSKRIIVVSRAGFEAEGYSDSFQIVDPARSQKNAGMVEPPFGVTPQSRSSR